MKIEKGRVRAPERKSSSREGGILSKVTRAAKVAATAPARAGKAAAMMVAGTPTSKNKTKSSVKASPEKTTQGAKKGGDTFEKNFIRRLSSNEATKSSKNMKGK